MSAERWAQVEPGTFNVVLGRRKGFVRLALQTGSSLVPVVSFGENDMFQVRKEAGNASTPWTR